ncbi:tryptophan--tRNA ligase [Telluribacter sp.]|jgi:tryptophanyl-tRNA synthetase|uniref:tryptophan--tRNA ligase n=1 Tax=Telluribacter sp. TaxID=1978767 RepID=UPI002E0ED3F4|nr:tryptophan--tRNA ligase [Telluribacter sp.]
MARILTGIQSSGRPHLGNILGAIQPAIELSRDPQNESFFFIADLHSLITIKEGSQREEYIRAIAATWLAFGFDTDRNVFWRQSRVQEHTELAWYLSCFTPFPMLANAHSFKEKSERLSDVNAGLFTYPVLQAADILLYDANIVPVGKDQKQHLEMTRDIASALNRQVGKEVLVLPESRIDEKLMVIPGLDGQKMSKSYHNYIDIFLPEKDLRKVVMKIVSDSTPLEEPKNPDTDITYQLYSLLATEAEVAQMRQNYQNGGYGYGHAKQALYELFMESFEEPRRIYNYYMENPGELERKLEEGEEKARQIARNTISRVRQALGFGS